MDAMLYFMVNSTLLLGALGIVFFLLGLWMGLLLRGNHHRPASSPGQARELSNLRGRLKALQKEQGKQQKYIEALEGRLRQAQEGDGSLPPLQADGMSEPAPASDAELEALHGQLSRLKADLDIEKGSNATLNADLSATAARAETAEKKLAAAQRERDYLREELREMESQLAPPLPEASEAVPAPAASNDSDDLAQLRGVGDVIRGKLQEQGIHSFRQIAQWSSDEIEHFSQALGCGERIQRDDWVGQARRLHQEKYGEEI
jgi:predicted flap endonuclease-1-like 5' DNA nuclease